MYYDGDYNGISIDFKEDGTYIFDNSAIGLSNYTYGIYKIDSNKITLDEDRIDNLTYLKHLEIRNRQIKYKDSVKSELYLFQVNETGDIIENGFEYRIIFDNRK